MTAIAAVTSADGHRPGVLSTVRELRVAERRMRWAREEIDQQQLLQLQRVLSHAVAAVPFYRARHPRGVTVRSLTDLAHLPLVHRGDLTGLPLEDRRGSPVTAETLTKRTSGTTSEFLTVELSARAAWWQGIVALRRNRARGLQPWERTAAIHWSPDRRARRGLLGSLARRSAVLDAADDPATLAAALSALEPVAISGFGHLLIDVGRQLDGRLRPRVVGTGGQVLARSDRRAIADAFGAFPLDLYGAVEVGSVAWQCSAADLYHVDHDSVFVEVVDRHGAPLLPGETGDVVVTTLQNPHMPFVRYRLGDRARFASRPCRCGSPGPAIEEIEGREMDWFVDERGVAVSSSRLFLTRQLDDVVHRYRVVQDEQGRVTVEVVPAGALPAEAVARIVEGYHAVLGASVPVAVEAVDDLPLEPSGKLRQFVSRALPAREAR